MSPLFCLGGDVGLPAGRERIRVTARQMYRRGKADLEAKRYPEAISSFKGLIDGFPSDPLVPSARKYLAIAKARKKAAEAASARETAQGAEQPKLMLKPVYPERKPEEEEAVPVKGNPANCKPHRASDRLRVCNWYDAMAYCEGRLPTVIQLQELDLAECSGGNQHGICGCRIWSSQGDGANAKTVITHLGGEIQTDRKSQSNIFVLCDKPAGN